MRSVCLHAAAAFHVPAAGRIEPGLLPQFQFLLVGAGIIAAGNKSGADGSDPSQGRSNRQAAAASRIARRPDQNKIVVHDIQSFDSKTIGHELFFGLAVMDQQHISIAVAGQAHGLAGAHGNDPDRAVEFFFKGRDQGVKEARIQGRGGRGQDQLVTAWQERRKNQDLKNQRQNQVKFFQFISLPEKDSRSAREDFI